MAVGVSAGWPSVSGRMASGLSPRGVASFYTLGRGLRSTRVEWSAIYPVPTPHLFPNSSGAPRALTPAGVEIAFLAGFVVLPLHW